MSRVLHAWDNGRLIGRFTKTSNGTVTFSYEPNEVVPISLSLPPDGRWASDTPRNFLENLLPDGKTERLRMQNALNAPTDDAFDLLESVDAVGGITFTAEESLPERIDSIRPMTRDDVAAQMQRVWETSDSWWESEGQSRFSLTGSQGKFTVAVRANTWFWPSATMPSTHIIKPDGKTYPGVAEVEHATMEAARAIGLVVPACEVINLGDRVGYLVERFDREVAKDGTVRRCRAEDLAQALGVSGDNKYDIEIKDVCAAFRRAHLCDAAIYTWLAQVAYNAYVGNADAHAKNYSILINENGVHIAPLYDAISMCHWPDLKYGTLAMPINNKYDPWEVTLADWRAEALFCKLDPDKTENVVRTVVGNLAQLDWQSLPCPNTISAEIGTYVGECTRDILPDIL